MDVRHHSDPAPGGELLVQQLNHLGNYYQEAGWKALDHKDDASAERLIAELKAAGRQKEIQKELERMKKTRYRLSC